jgi:hypothetical protein
VFVTPPPRTLQKPSQKIGKTKSFPRANQKPFFSAVSAAFEGGGDGPGFGVKITKTAGTWRCFSV